MVSLTASDSFEKIPNGLCGMELRIPVLFSEELMKGRIDINRFVAISSLNSAKIFGLYPRKGVLAVGSDADIVIMDPKIKKRITREDSMYHMEWYPHEGMNVAGWPVLTFCKGAVVAENAVYVGPKGAGEFIPRSLSEADITRPIA